MLFIILLCVLIAACIAVCIFGIFIYRRNHRVAKAKTPLSHVAQLCLPLVSLDARLVADSWYLTDIFEDYDFIKQPAIRLTWIETKVTAASISERDLQEQITFCRDCKAGKYYRENEITYKILEKYIVKNSARRSYMIRTENSITHKESILKVALQYWCKLTVGGEWHSTSTKFTQLRKS